MAPLLIRGGTEWVGPQRMEVRRTDGKQGEGRENEQDANIRPLLLYGEREHAGQGASDPTHATVASDRVVASPAEGERRVRAAAITEPVCKRIRGQLV